MAKVAERRPAEIVLLDDALRFLRAVWDIQRALQSSSKQMERTIGVTGPQRRRRGCPGTPLRFPAAAHARPRSENRPAAKR